MHVQIVAPVKEFVELPVGHAVHEAEFVDAAYVFTAQVVHESDAPLPAVDFPAAQTQVD